MGFYGNITNAARTQFSFDHTYSNRAQMDASIKLDGIFVGRYVLVDYDKECNTEDFYEGYLKDGIVYSKISGQNPITFLAEGANSGTVKIPSNRVERIPANSFIKIPLKKNFDKEIKGYTTDIIVTLTDSFKTNTKAQVYSLSSDGTTLSPTENTTTIYYSETSYLMENPTVKEDSYIANFKIDINKYGTSRGYDSTVWQKVITGGVERYVMIAELNTVVPTFDVAADPPSMTPLAPHYDKDSTNVYYKIHMQPSWGFRVKAADAKIAVPQLDQNNKALGARTLASSDNTSYPSDMNVVWTNLISENNQLTSKKLQLDDQHNGTWVSTEAAGGINELPAAIYFNKNGLDKYKSVHSQDLEFFKDSDANYDSINILPTGRSGHLYLDHQTSGSSAVLEDSYEMSIMLPSIGDTIADVWDIVYGPGKNALKERNTVINWEDGKAVQTKEGLRLVKEKSYELIKVTSTSFSDYKAIGLYTKKDASETYERIPDNATFDSNESYYIYKGYYYSYDPENANTLAGIINSAQDILGMIITSDMPTNNAEIQTLNADNIYYDKLSGKYYRKAKTYEYDTSATVKSIDLVDFNPETWRWVDKPQASISDYIKSNTFYDGKKYVESASIKEGAKGLSLSAKYEPKKYYQEETEVYTLSNTPRKIYKKDNHKYDSHVNYYDLTMPVEIGNSTDTIFYAPNVFYKADYKMYKDGNLSPREFIQNSYHAVDNPKGTRFFASYASNGYGYLCRELKTINDLLNEMSLYEKQWRSVTGLTRTEFEKAKDYLYDQPNEQAKANFYNATNTYYEQFLPSYTKTLNLNLATELKYNPDIDYYIVDISKNALGNSESNYYTISETYEYVPDLSKEEYRPYVYYSIQRASQEDDPVNKYVDSSTNTLYSIYTPVLDTDGYNDDQGLTLYFKKRSQLILSTTDNMVDLNSAELIDRNKVIDLSGLTTEVYYDASSTGAGETFIQVTPYTLAVDRALNYNNGKIKSSIKFYTFTIKPFVSGYAPNAYYYELTEDVDNKLAGSLIVDNSLEPVANRTYYAPIDIEIGKTISQQIYTPNKYYYKDGNNYILDSSPTKRNVKYYLDPALYVASSTNPDFPAGMKWPSANISNLPNGVSLGTRKEVYKLEELTSFATKYNTLYGMLLRLHEILEDGDPLTRRDDTVQGCINRLNDIIHRFNATIPGTVLIASDYGNFVGAPTNGDDWINITITSDPKQPKIQLEHKALTTTESTSTQNLSTNKAGTTTFETIKYEFDDTNHYKSKEVKTITMPNSYGKFTGDNASVVSEADCTHDTFSLTGDNWIQTTVSKDKVAFAHIGPVAVQHTPVTNETPTFGSTFTIKDLTFDVHGHYTSDGTHTVTIPKGSLTQTTAKTAGNVLTSIDFVDTTGAITVDRTNLGELQLGTYTAPNELVAADTKTKISALGITTTTPLNTALANLDAKVMTETKARIDAIDALDVDALNNITGKVLVNISQTNGVIDASNEYLGAITLGDYEAPTGGKNIANTSTLSNALSTLDARIYTEEEARKTVINNLTYTDSTATNTTFVSKVTQADGQIAVEHAAAGTLNVAGTEGAVGHTNSENLNSLKDKIDLLLADNKTENSVAYQIANEAIRINNIVGTPDEGKTLQDEIDEIEAIPSYSITEEQITNWDSAYEIKHTHNNKELLDTYAQTEEDLANAVEKAHKHENKTVLDTITQEKIDQWDAAEPNDKDTVLSSTEFMYSETEQLTIAGLMAKVAALEARIYRLENPEISENDPPPITPPETGDEEDPIPTIPEDPEKKEDSEEPISPDGPEDDIINPVPGQEDETT